MDARRRGGTPVCGRRAVLGLGRAVRHSRHRESLSNMSTSIFRPVSCARRWTRTAGVRARSAGSPSSRGWRRKTVRSGMRIMPETPQRWHRGWNKGKMWRKTPIFPTISRRIRRCWEDCSAILRRSSRRKTAVRCGTINTDSKHFCRLPPDLISAIRMILVRGAPMVTAVRISDTT